MGERDLHEALARAGIEAFNRGDAGAVTAALHPEIETHISSRMMNHGTWRGPEGFREGVGAWADAWDDLNFEIVEVEAVDDDHVLVVVHQTAVGPGSGIPVEMDAVFLFGFEEGRARRFHVHPDRESAEAAI